MLVTTSGDGVIGTFDDLLIGTFVDTNAEHEYLFIMERSDCDVNEGGSLLPDELTRRSRVCCII